ncbi:MAG TPA: hypothetical protein VKU36_01595 [Candidatus Babeliales bacterium]|nr:hypothetical protein [Candidatus Babeliales bacterium]
MQKIIIVSTLLFAVNNYGMLITSRVKHFVKTTQSRHLMPFDLKEINLEAFQTIYQLKAENQFLKEQIRAKNILLSQHKIKTKTITEEMFDFISDDQHRTNGV